MTSDIAAGLQTPFRDAELLKMRSGYALARAVGREQMVEVPSVGGRPPRLLSRHKLSQIIEARAEEILSLMRNQIVQCGFDEGLGSGVVLTGGSGAARRHRAAGGASVSDAGADRRAAVRRQRQWEWRNARRWPPRHSRRRWVWLHYGARPRDHIRRGSTTPGSSGRSGSGSRGGWRRSFEVVNRVRAGVMKGRLWRKKLQAERKKFYG